MRFKFVKVITTALFVMMTCVLGCSSPKSKAQSVNVIDGITRTLTDGGLLYALETESHAFEKIVAIGFSC